MACFKHFIGQLYIRPFIIARFNLSAKLIFNLMIDFILRSALFNIINHEIHLTIKSRRQTLKQEIRFYRLVVNDCRTPARARLLLWAAIGYALLPFDIIPDFIPIVSHLNDLIIIPFLIIIAFKIIPDEVTDGCRAKSAAK
jgi:uncharacterized membrane protein YkvA (DUF1232 family)